MSEFIAIGIVFFVWIWWRERPCAERCWECWKQRKNKQMECCNITGYHCKYGCITQDFLEETP